MENMWLFSTVQEIQIQPEEKKKKSKFTFWNATG